MLIQQQVSPQTIKEMAEKLDPGNMLGIAFRLYEQLEEIYELSKKWKVPEFFPDNILILGMGGSAIGGALIRSYCLDKIDVPIEVLRNYDIPAYVNEETLCIASSYSGNTEETMSAYEECINRNTPVLSVSTGGALEHAAKARNGLHYVIPRGLQPRSALGYSLASLFVLLIKGKILEVDIELLKKSSALLNKLCDRWANWDTPDENPPLNLALKVQGKIPVIYGSSGYAEAMSYRWKCQFNENAKMLSYWTNFPELNHNEIVGWGDDEELRKRMFVIFIRDENEHPRVESRIDLTKKHLAGKVLYDEVYPEGESDLEKLFYLTMYGDLLTIYSAYLHGKDPAEIDAIHWLKSELSKL
jgi:glucose/mannose-6-phosphate isomerase